MMVYWIVAENKVEAVVLAGTEMVIWLFACVQVPSLVADAVASVIGVEYVPKSVVGVPVRTSVAGPATAALPVFRPPAVGDWSTVIVKSAQGM